MSYNSDYNSGQGSGKNFDNEYIDSLLKHLILSYDELTSQYSRNNLKGYETQQHNEYLILGVQSTKTVVELVNTLFPLDEN